MTTFPTHPTVGETVHGARGEIWGWDGFKWTIAPATGGSVGFLPLLGGKMDGPLLLHEDAVDEMEPPTLRQLEAKASGTAVGNEEPQNPNVGAQWFDTSGDLLKIWNGDEWQVVGGNTGMQLGMLYTVTTATALPNGFYFISSSYGSISLIAGSTSPVDGNDLTGYTIPGPIVPSDGTSFILMNGTQLFPILGVRNVVFNVITAPSVGEVLPEGWYMMLGLTGGLYPNNRYMFYMDGTQQNSNTDSSTVGWLKITFDGSLIGN